MVALVLTMLLAAAAPDAPDPLAPATEGKAQCYAPDTVKKICVSTSTFSRLPDGSIQNRALVRLSPSPLIVMDTRSVVTVKGGAVCSPYVAADVDNAKFTINTEPATDEMAAQFKQRLKDATAALLNHEICTAFVPDGAGFRAEVSVDGKRNPSMDQPFIWVGPSDGYHIGR